MLILFILFAGFLWALAKSPQAVIHGGLALMWLMLAVGCTASVVSAL
jgi:hypothetical protein